MGSFQVDVEASLDVFDEEGYLALNPDIAKAVSNGQIASGRLFLEIYGNNDGRKLRRTALLRERQALKAARIAWLLRADLPWVRRGNMFDCLTDALRRDTRIVPTDAISGHEYAPDILAMIDRCADGLVLDCGAGQRPTYYDNVINLEIVDYATTDVLCVGEQLPFEDGSIDAVISAVVLEHVADPFKCAAEIVRVLKPGGELICCVPFLQPEHGYPHHYYNMTRQGLRALFDRHLIVDLHYVADSTLPIWALTWILQSWQQGLVGSTKETFLDLRVRDLIVSAGNFLTQPWVRELSYEKNMELASATTIHAHKPLAG